MYITSVCVRYGTVGERAGARRPAAVTRVAAGREPAHRCRAEGALAAADGRDGSRGRSVREDLSARERATRRQEEDARQEAHAQPGLQRELRVRAAGRFAQRCASSLVAN